MNHASHSGMYRDLIKAIECLNMTHAVVQSCKENETKWSEPTKIHFDAEGRAELYSSSSADLGDSKVILEHSLSPHVVKVIQAAGSEVMLRTDNEPITVLKPDGGNQTIFEYKDGDGTMWHVYHASKKPFSFNKGKREKS